MTALYQLTEQFRELERLAELEDLPEDAVRDTLDGLSGEIEVKATHVAMFAENLSAGVAAIRERAKAMQERADRIERRAQWIRNYLLNNLKAAGITKIDATEFVIRVQRNPPSVVVDDEGKVPQEYFVEVPATFRLDKKAVSDALKAGTDVPGARLQQTERLVVKA